MKNKTYYSENIIRANAKDVKLKSSKEINELVKQYQETGDEYILNQILEQTCKLILKLSNDAMSKFSLTNKFDLVDLYQEGTIGLLRALELYDINAGVNFTTYAYYHIQSKIERYIDNNSNDIKVPVHAAVKMRQIMYDIKMEGVDYSIDDIIKKYGVKLETATAIFCTLNNKHFSIDLLLTHEKSLRTKTAVDELYLYDDFNLEEYVVNKNYNNYLIQILLDKLNEVEKCVIINKFGLNGEEPKTYESIGKMCNKSRQNTYKIYMKAMRKIRWYMTQLYSVYKNNGEEL